MTKFRMEAIWPSLRNYVQKFLVLNQKVRQDDPLRLCQQLWAEYLQHASHPAKGCKNTEK